MKLSKYNLYFEENGILKIVNTKQGSIVNIDDRELQNKINLFRKQTFAESNDKNEIILKQLGIITDDNFEECEDPNDKTLNVTLFVTKKCNFRCSYCYEKFEDEDLSYDSYEKIIRFIKIQLAQKEFSIIRINLFGGEPLIVYEKILWFLKHLREAISDVNVDLSIGMTTNGYLLDIEKYKTLVDLGLKDVQITIDGFKHTHNKTRGLVNGDGTWDRIIENLYKISIYSSHTDVILRTNFNAEILHDAKKFLKYCRNKFNNQFIMHFEAIKKFSMNYKGECINKEFEKNAIIELICFCKSEGINHIYKNILSKGFFSCPQCASNSFTFDTKLNVLKCTVLLGDNYNYIGKLDENGRLQLNGNLSYWNNTCNECSKCELYPLCFGRKCLGKAIKDKESNCEYESLRKNLYHIINASFDR